jgi:YfiH family protein
MLLPADWIIPDWPAPPSVKAFVTTRNGGVSNGPYASLNLGARVGDNPEAVGRNRERVRASLPSDPKWLQQVHGTAVMDAAVAGLDATADGAFTREASIVCAVQIADCLPVLLCQENGKAVAVAHAGWRGLAAGVIERTTEAMAGSASELMCWLGPAIGPEAFEVGEDVFLAFTGQDTEAAKAFTPRGHGKWMADLFSLARMRLRRAGVERVYGGGMSTFSDAKRFFSHRRDRVTGRQAAFIWLQR